MKSTSTNERLAGADTGGAADEGDDEPVSIVPWPPEQAWEGWLEPTVPRGWIRCRTLQWDRVQQPRRRMQWQR